MDTKEETNNDQNKLGLNVAKFSEIPDFQLNPKEKFKEFISHITENAKKIMYFYHHLPPAIFFVMENGEVYFDEMNQFMKHKHILVDLVKEVIKIKVNPSIYGVIFASEAWISKLSGKDAETPVEQIAPVSERSDKIEAIMILGQTPNYYKIISVPFERIDNDMIIFVQQEEIESMDTRLRGLLNFYE